MYKRNAQNQWEIAQQLPKLPDVSFSPTGNFGWDLAIGLDQTIYVGAPYQENAAGDTVGALYLYRKVGDEWPLPPDPLSEGDDGDEFGWSVAVDDDGSLVVGATRAAAVSPQSGGVSRAGVVYEYDIETDGSITLTQTLDSGANAVEGGEYGYSVDLNNADGTYQDYLVVGQRNPLREGSIYIYKWSQLTSPDDHIFSFQGSFREGGIEGRYGTAVAVVGSHILAGAPQEDDTGLSGAVFTRNLPSPPTCNDDNLCTVDTYDSSQGVCVFTPVLCGEGEVCDPNDGECHMPPPPTSRITPGDAAANNGFGKSVAITQTPVDNIKTAIIGAPGKAPGEDAAYVFDLDSEERWVEVPNGKLNSSRQGRCGTSVAVFGNFYFVGCPSYGK